MSSLGGILLLVGGGILIYFLLKNQNLVNLNTSQNIPDVTPSTVQQLQKLIPNLEGSQVTGFIHGGTIGGYRGTNGKIYASYEDALRNGAA